jgi:hypothetical protein
MNVTKVPVRPIFQTISSNYRHPRSFSILVTILKFVYFRHKYATRNINHWPLPYSPSSSDSHDGFLLHPHQSIIHCHPPIRRPTRWKNKPTNYTGSHAQKFVIETAKPDASLCMTYMIARCDRGNGRNQPTRLLIMRDVVHKGVQTSNDKDRVTGNTKSHKPTATPSTELIWKTTAAVVWNSWNVMDMVFVSDCPVPSVFVSLSCPFVGRFYRVILYSPATGSLNDDAMEN